VNKPTIAASTHIGLCMAWLVVALMYLARLPLPGVPGATAIGALFALTGLHMIVFRQWWADFNRRWKAIPGMYVGTATATLWIAFGIFFAAFGLLLIWAGVYAAR
jgi:hypothetical protein